MTDAQILDTLGLTDVSTELQHSILVNIRSIAETRLVLLLDEILTDVQREQFEALQGQDDASATWFLEQFPQLQDLYDGIIEDILTDDKFNPGLKQS